MCKCPHTSGHVVCARVTAITIQPLTGEVNNTDLIHGGPTSQHTAANVLMPDTTVHFQRSSGVHASAGQGCLVQ